MISALTVTSRTCLLSLLWRLEWVLWLLKRHWVVFLCLQFADSLCPAVSLTLRPLLIQYSVKQLSAVVPLRPEGALFQHHFLQNHTKWLFRWQNCTVLLRVRCHASLLAPSCLPAVKRWAQTRTSLCLPLIFCNVLSIKRFCINSGRADFSWVSLYCIQKQMRSRPLASLVLRRIRIRNALIGK